MGTHRVADLAPRDAYRLPDALRGELAGDFGPVLQTDDLAAALAGAPCIVAVGDIVARTLHGLGIQPRLFVCDYKTQRGDDDAQLREVLGSWGDLETRVANPPATVTREAWLAVRHAFLQPADTLTRIVVDGEEDLLGLPAFWEAPADALVLYGAPGRGVVVARADGAIKARVADLVARMDGS